MKKIFILLSFVISTLNSSAQVTFLAEEHFDNCAVYGENYPNYWTAYDIFTNPLIAWTCGPSDGRGATSTTTSPGIKCNNYDGVNYYVDTAWLFTPQLNLSWISGNVYLQFDTKFINNAARLSILVSNTYTPGSALAGQTWTDITATSNPVLNNMGTSTWTTHVVDLTPYKASPVYVAFRYTSDMTGSGTWIIDNVLTTQIPFTGLPVIEKSLLSLNVYANNTPGQVTLTCDVPVAATYQLSIYDMVGRLVHKELINTPSGSSIHTINNLDLRQGIYLVKMENGNDYNTAKLMIR